MSARTVALNLLFLVPGETGGMEVYARALAPALVAARPHLEFVVLAAHELAEELRQRPWWDGMTVVALPVSGRARVRRIAAEQTLVPIAARRAGADVVHSLGNTGPLLTPGCAHVVTVHDLIYASHPETHAGLLRLGVRVVVPATVRSADRIIAISRHTRDDLVRLLGIPADKIDVVPNGPGVDGRIGPTPEGELRERYGLGDAPLVLAVSARRPHKNLERLIEAIGRLENEATLVLPGYPSAHDRRLRERGGDRVRVLDWVDGADLEGLYSAATCLAFPSLAEGFGLPVLEAMRRGVPVACSDAASLPEVAAGAALLFDPLDVNAIAACIDRLLVDASLREELAARGLERARCFSWDKTAKGVLDAYDAALRTHGVVA